MQSTIDNLVELHFLVLKEIFKGASFNEINNKYSNKMKELDYIAIAKVNNLLSFDEKNNLIHTKTVQKLQ